jgi:glycerol uptake facilitator-like aquaporin
MSIQLGFQSGDFGLSTWRKVCAEFIATALLVLIGTGAVGPASRRTTGGWWTSVAWRRGGVPGWRRSF